MTRSISLSFEDHKKLQDHLFNIRRELVQIGGMLQKLPKGHSAVKQFYDINELVGRVCLSLENEAYKWFDLELVANLYLKAKKHPEPFPHDYSTWLTAKKANQITGVSIKQLNELAEHGKIICTQINHGWLFEPASVIDLFDQQKVLNGTYV